MNTQQHEFRVQGMSCQHCVRGVTLAIREHDPQAEVEVDLGQGRVLTRTTLPREAVAQAIASEGYEVQTA